MTLAKAEGEQVFHRGAGGADAGEDHAVGGADPVRLIGYFAAMAQVIERVRRRW